jgi:hypothetical protein
MCYSKPETINSMRIPTKAGRAAGAVVCLALAVLGLPASGSGAEEAPASIPKLGPLEKSLIFPGWGQMSERYWVKGVAFAVAELACLGAAIHHNSLGNENYTYYRAAADELAAVRYRSLVVRHDGRRNAFLLAAAVVWAVNLIDIYRLVQGKETKPGALSLGIEHGPSRELRLSLGCRF